MQKCIVAIVGAGPAGLTAGIKLAEEGIETIIFEEHKEIGYPLQCGEGVSNAVFETFKIPKTKEIVKKEVRKTVLYFPNSTAIYGDIKAYMISRPKFDQYLAKTFEEKGGTIFRNTKVMEARKEKEGIKLIAKKDGRQKKEEIKCKYAIFAEGARARVARTMGYKEPAPYVYAYEVKVEGTWTETLDFYFDAEKYPTGYAWVFPREEETNVGVVTTKKDTKKRLENFMKEIKIKGEIKGKVAGIIPMKGPAKKIYDERTMVVGDAGGMVNPIFYGGIRIGMTSGKTAAETIVEVIKEEKTKREEVKLKKYEEKLNRYAFMKKVNVKAHERFYRMNNKELNLIGKMFDKQYINRINILTAAKPIAKYATMPRLWIKPKTLYLMYKGFKIARKWGF